MVVVVVVVAVVAVVVVVVVVVAVVVAALLVVAVICGHARLHRHGASHLRGEGPPWPRASEARRQLDENMFRESSPSSFVFESMIRLDVVQGAGHRLFVRISMRLEANRMSYSLGPRLAENSYRDGARQMWAGCLFANRSRMRMRSLCECLGSDALRPISVLRFWISEGLTQA